MTRSEGFYRALGASLLRFRAWVLLAWVALFVAGALGSGMLPRVLQGGTGAIPGTPSARAEAHLREQFDNPFSLGLAIPLHHARQPMSAPEQRDLVRQMAARLRAHPLVARVSAPGDPGSRAHQPADPRSAVVLVGLRARDLTRAEEAVGAIRADLASFMAGRPPDPDLTWHLTGRPALTHDINAFSIEDSARAESRGLPLTAIVLLIGFGSWLAAGLPLVLGVVAITVSSGLLAAMAALMPVSTYAQSVGSMLGLSLGIDYALIMVLRFREALGRGLEVDEAVLETVATAGRAVVVSGLTVAIGFGGLLSTRILDTRSMGAGGMLVTAVAVLIALTLLPVVLALAGKRLARRRWFPEGASSRWANWTRRVLAAPGRSVVLAFALVGLVSAPAWQLHGGFPTGRWIPASLPYQQGYEALLAMGLAGAIAPVDLVLVAKEGSGPALSGARVPVLVAFSRALKADPRVARVLSPVDLDPPLSPAMLQLVYRDPERLAARFPLLRELFFSHDRRSTLFQVMLRGDVGYEEGKAFVRDWTARPPAGFDLLVGGGPAYFVDFDRVMEETVPRVVGLVIGATLLALGFTYRSWLVPVKAVVLNLLSVGAGLGAVVAVFQFGWGASWFGVDAPLDRIPVTVGLSLFCIVFGLSMDYEVFLLHRIKEAYDRGLSQQEATLEGLSSTGGLVTSAAAVMLCVFGAFARAEFVAVQMLGLGLAVAVFVDATLVRFVLLPALMALLGDANWYPGGRKSTSP
ncbi:MAG: MMPL family transporter [bacterium]|nr:MMPL family transporter [bacterium]